MADSEKIQKKNTKHPQQSNNAIIIVMKPYIPIPWYYTVRSLLFSYCDEFAQRMLYTIKYKTRIIT